MVHSEDTNLQNNKIDIFDAAADYVESLEQSSPAGASEEFGPDIGIPSNYEANQAGTKKSLTGFEVSKNIGRL